MRARGLQSGDRIEVDPSAGTIRNTTKGRTYSVIPFAPFLQELIREGGLVPYVRQRLSAAKGA